MKAFHCVLLFALAAFTSTAVDAADDDDTTQGPNDVEVCEDNYICEGLIGNTMCQLKSAADFCPVLCQKGCGAPEGSTRKREMEELEEYKQKKIKAARAYQTDCRDDDNTCCNADEICNMIHKDHSRNMCRRNKVYCCKTCTDFYGRKDQWKKNQLLALLTRILED